MSNENEKLGQKIRKMRQNKGLKLAGLAAMIKKTPSYLSQVERGLAEPSITALREICRALEVPLFYFFVDDRQQSALVRKEQRRVLNFPDAKISFELISPDINHQMELIEFHLKPGASTGPTPQSHSGEECSLVLEGEMEIQVGEQFYTLERGDSIYYQASIPHRITNIGEGELVFISAITPPNF